MAKRKNNGRNMEGKRVEIDEKELAKYANSYIGTFEILSKQGGNTIDAMIAAVAIMNSKLLILAAHGPESIPEKTKEEIIEAYQYIEPKMLTSEKNQEKILENWFGNMPLFFRMGETFLYEKEYRHLQEGYTNLSKLDKFKFEQIFDYIWEKRTWRHLVVDDWHMEIPKTIYREELDSYKNTIRSLILKFFEAPNAALIFTFERKDGKIQASALHHHHNMIEQISPEELKLTYSFDAETGKPIDPPDNYVFTTFDFKC